MNKSFSGPVKFSAGDIEQHLQNALRDLEIACKDPFPEVQFPYSFQALIKAGIALLAAVGNVKVRSIPGHHVKILTKMSEILSDPDIIAIGNAMRMKRNTDLYGGGTPISEKEAKEYFQFVKSILEKVRKALARHA